jgi:argininosuccinate lyase
MLVQTGVLTPDELESLNEAFDKLLEDWQGNKFKISLAQEDGHTAIEQYLVETCGDLGKKIHTARSRNDQVLVMMRLYEKEMLGKISHALEGAAKAFYAAAEKFNDQQMPGYTHMQKAMPTTVGMWLSSFADALIDSQGALSAAQVLIDQNPLGSASGFGIANFPIPEELTTKELGFTKTQKNPMYCGISRGLFESAILNAQAPIMILASRFASDMLLFTTDEFSFFSLPREFTTGSSIMPNKQNYDLFEIMRANWPVFASYQQQVQNIAGALPSGYSRDLQLTKKPVIQGLELVLATLQLLAEIAPQLKANTPRLNQAMSAELFATEKVYELVKTGESFRDAYRQIKERMNL